MGNLSGAKTRSSPITRCRQEVSEAQSGRPDAVDGVFAPHTPRRSRRSTWPSVDGIHIGVPLHWLRRLGYRLSKAGHGRKTSRGLLPGRLLKSV